MSKIKGVFNILATPFNADKAVDTASLKNLVEFQIDKGAHGLTILGVMGEAAKLSVDERKLIIDTVMDTVDGRIPVAVGTSHDDVETCIELSQSAFNAGADGVMIAPPRMDNPTDEKVLNLYRKIADNISQPIIVQDFPPVNAVIMSPDFLATLADEIPNARHLKLEDPPLMQKIARIREKTQKYELFGGLGGMFFLEELNRGASGTMTGFAFTEILVAVYEAHQEGRIADAERIFDQYAPLIRYENQPDINLTIRKELLHRRGAIANATPREPFSPIDQGTHDEISRLFQRMEIKEPIQKITFDTA